MAEVMVEERTEEEIIEEQNQIIIDGCEFIIEFIKMNEQLEDNYFSELISKYIIEFLENEKERLVKINEIKRNIKTEELIVVFNTIFDKAGYLWLVPDADEIIDKKRVMEFCTVIMGLIDEINLTIMKVE